MTLHEFLFRVQSVLLPATAMPADPIGTHVASSTGIVNRVLTCLEITDAVIDEALTCRCDTIVTFHPLIYVPLKAIADQNRVARLVARLIRNDLSVLAVHTTFDAFPQGTNAILAGKLGLEVVRPLVQSPMTAAGVTTRHGMGLLASCNMTFTELLDRTASVMGSPLRFSIPQNDTITSVAIVAGSGMSLYTDAVASGAQVFLTADVRYHDFHAASSEIGIIDPGHYEMEQFVGCGMATTLTDSIPECAFVASRVNTSPVRYHFSAESSAN